MRGLVRARLVGICLAAYLVCCVPPAAAHGVVGKRMFIEPLVTKDANVKNEFDLPAAGFRVQPDGSWRVAGFSLEKALYPHRLSLAVADDWIGKHREGKNLSGWDNLRLGLKWEAFTNVPHEFILSPAVFFTLPTSDTEITPHQTTLLPMVAYGKGFDDVGVSRLRPFAIQGDAGFQSSISGPRTRNFVYDDVLMYSFPYLNHWVRQADENFSLNHNLRRGFSAGAFFGNLYPFVEFNASTALATLAGTTADLRPGILWVGKYAQVSIGAELPLRSPGIGAPHPGVIVLVDWFVDEIFPRFSWTPFGRASRDN